MNVKLVAVTQPSDPQIKTAEDLIVYCARVSNPNNQLNFETGPKLINYLVKHKHFSPFEMVDMTVEIKTSRGIAAQILRHRSACFQEFSQRYQVVQDFEDIEFRMQGKTNRQVGDTIAELPEEIIEEINNLQNNTSELYNKLISIGVAKESARFLLPLNTQTTMYMKNNIRNWLAYFNVRLTEHTQKEHRLIAEAIRDIFVQEFPVISEAFGGLRTGDFM